MHKLQMLIFLPYLSEAEIKSGMPCQLYVILEM